MIVAFKDWNLREVVEDENKCLLLYGKEATDQLKNRLLDIFAAENLADIEVLVGKLEELKDKEGVFFLLNLTENFQLEFIPNHIKHLDYLLEDGTIDLSLIDRIKITSINKVV